MNSELSDGIFGYIDIKVPLTEFDVSHNFNPGAYSK